MASDSPSLRRLTSWWGIGCVMVLLLLARPTLAQSFDVWLEGVRNEALARGLDATTFDRAMLGVRPFDEIVELDRRQPEFTQTFWNYHDKRVTQQRIERGRAMLTRYRPLLERIERRYGVQPRFLVALWGLESNFGDNTGGFPLFGALATLGYDARRGEFFRQQLLAALAGAQRGDIPLDALSSWAGAMGQPQFIPTTYEAYAVDFDGDGRIDLWNSVPDVLASAANYLASSGWRGDQTWGREVWLPIGFDYAQTGLERPRSLAEWHRLGVRSADGSALPSVDRQGAIVLPGGADGGPAILVYPNFRAIIAWNRSILYAVAVGSLANRMNGEGPFVAVRPVSEVALSRMEVMELQDLLGRLGFDTGGVDGIVGSQTRNAIRGFQQQAMLPADGHPSSGLLRELRSAAYR